MNEADELRTTLTRERAAHAEYRARVEADREEGLRRVRELETERDDARRVCEAQGDKMLVMAAALSRAAERQARWDYDMTDDRRRALHPGTHVRVINDFGDEVERVTRTVPWRIYCGEWLVGLNGEPGGYSLARVVAVWRGAKKEAAA